MSARDLRAMAVILREPGSVSLASLTLTVPGPQDVVVDVAHSGISTGTEKLLWSGKMPAFPGLGYPLVPGYEAAGTVVAAGAESGFHAGDSVFVPGASCFTEARCLFGASASRIVVAGARAVAVDRSLGADATLLALAATAYRALVRREGGDTILCLPELIVGHGVLGRLAARLVQALGGAPPVVWETSAARREGRFDYTLVEPVADTRRDYRRILDMSGDCGILDQLVARLSPEGEVVLAGFYAAPLSFTFPPAFMREARFRISAEFKPADLAAVTALVVAGRLSLSGLITHRSAAADAPAAYEKAFTDPSCLKMVLDWRHPS